MIFLIMGAVGLALLLFSFLFDGIFDLIDFDVFDNGLLSMTGLASFVALFGFAGFICESTGQGPAVTAGSAVSAGLIGLVSTGAAMRFMKKQSQPDNAWDNSSMVGRSAVVISAAKAGEYGTIAVAWNGLSESVAALSTEDLVKGDEVIITHVLSHSSVRVQKIGAVPPSALSEVQEGKDASLGETISHLKDGESQ